MPEHPQRSTKEERRYEDATIQAAVLKELNRHRGRAAAIGMAELQEAVTGQRVEHRINGSRLIRGYIDQLQREGQPICSCPAGYYVASGSELEDYLKEQRLRALRILAKAAMMGRTALPDLLGQMRLQLRPQGDQS